MKTKILLFISAYTFFAFNFVHASSEYELMDGTWRMISDLDCDETHAFDKKGEVIVLSGNQKLKKGYLVTKFENSEFYKFETVVLANNNEPDCIGQLDSKVGDQLHLYVKFENRKNEIHFYGWPSEDGYLDVYLRIEK